MQTREEHKPKLSCFLCKFWTCKLERMQHQDSSANHIELQRGCIYVSMCWIDSKARIKYLGFLKGQSKVQAAQTQRKISLIFLSHFYFCLSRASCVKLRKSCQRITYSAIALCDDHKNRSIALEKGCKFVPFILPFIFSTAGAPAVATV